MGSSVLAADFAALLPAPGTMTGPSESFTPSSLKGVRLLESGSGLKLEFILTQGQDKRDEAVAQGNVRSLVSYFLSALTLSSDQMWVNLSPYEGERMIPDNFGSTEMGRDLLAQDYLLKQLTASLLYPEKDLGKKFWDEVYRQAKDQFGVTDIPVETFNKVWITPDKATVYENGMTGFILKSRLKVMLESDYVAMSRQKDIAEPVAPARDVAMSSVILRPQAEGSQRSLGRANEVSQNNTGGPSPSEIRRISERSQDDGIKQVMRSVVIPAIEKEINEGRQFAKLRQIYDAQILAVWFKTALKASVLGQSYADKGKIAGIDVNVASVNQSIYQRYMDAFRQGVFNYVKDETDLQTHEVLPRKYFSGGAKAWLPNDSEITHDFSQADLPDNANLNVVNVELVPSEAQRPNYISDRDMRRTIAVHYGILLLSHGGPLDIQTFFNYCNNLSLLQEDVFVDQAHRALEERLKNFITRMFAFNQEYHSLLHKVAAMEKDLQIGQVASSVQSRLLREEAVVWMLGSAQKPGVLQLLYDFIGIVSELDTPEIKAFMEHHPEKDLFLAVLETVVRVRDENAFPMIKYLKAISGNLIGEKAIAVSGEQISLSEFLKENEKDFKVKSDQLKEYPGSRMLFDDGDWGIKNVPSDLLWLVLERFKENGVGFTVRQRWAWDILQWIESQPKEGALTLSQLQSLTRDEMKEHKDLFVVLNKMHYSESNPPERPLEDRIAAEVEWIRAQRDLGLTKDDLKIAYDLSKKEINGKSHVVLTIRNPGVVGKKTVKMKNGEMREIDLLGEDFIPGVKNIFLNDPQRKNLTFGGLSIPFGGIAISNIAGASIDVRQIKDARGVSFFEIVITFAAADKSQTPAAESSGLKKDGPLGGIDLNEKNLQLDLKHGAARVTTGSGVSLTLDDAPGLVLVSIEVSPLQDLAAYLQGKS